MSEYGLSRLVLINSANYERAEIPLDDSVSIIGPNNAGKTSVINALQFLLIGDRRQMDFGAHDEAATLRFYFPGNASYILLEAQLESGAVVLGCVGKGTTHEYRHFAYTGTLRIDDYRRDDGTLVQEPDLAEHLALKGCAVQFYARPTEFFDAMYGRSTRRSPGDLDLRLYHLENPQLKKVFQQILVKTLRLDRLQAGDVKSFLLRIFETEYGAELDFASVWRRAFHQINADRLQYQSCRRLERQILDKLESSFGRRLELRGRILAMRPQIDQALDRWEAYRSGTLVDLELGDADLGSRLGEIDQSRDRLVEERVANTQRADQFRAQDARRAVLETEYALVADKESLLERVRVAEREYEASSVLLHSTQGGDAAFKERDLRSRREQITRLERRILSGERLLETALEKVLDPAELALLHGLAREQLFDLDVGECGDPAEFAMRFRAFLAGQESDGVLRLWGLEFDRRSLEVARDLRTRDDIASELAQQREEVRRLESEIEAIRDRASQESRVQRLRAELDDARRVLQEYEELGMLRASAAERAREFAELAERFGQVERLIEETKTQAAIVQERRRELQGRRADLERQHNAIRQLRILRKDGDGRFLEIQSLKHVPWYSTGSVEPDGLEAALRQQNDDCSGLERTDADLRSLLSEVVRNGFTKFQGIEDEDEQIQLVLNYARNLDAENETLQRAVRSAVTNVASSLKELERQYEQFRAKVKGFNNLIGKRRLSDLERFRIEIVESPRLLEAIRIILSSSEAIEMLESADLFDVAQAQDDAVGDRELDRAKDQLLQYSRVQGSLKLEHLFELEFEVAKLGQPAQRFDQLDKIGSNGTVLMAKLVSGLALLHQMLDARHVTRTICYLDEAASLDDANQTSLIETAREFGFNLLFASPTPQNTVRYCVPIVRQGRRNLVTRQHWQIFENIGETP